MKKHFLILIILLSLVISVSARIDEAVMFDQLDSTTTCEDMNVRLDYWAIERNKNPESKGYAIVYEGKYFRDVSNDNEKRKLKAFLPTFGESAFRTNLMMKYMFKVRKNSKQNFIFIDGGFRKNFSVELYISPNSAPPPKPSPTLENIKYRKGNPQFKCDDF
ncbi:MAG: hypothetical protein ABI686_03445 [Acidobacteriota bacterium]